MAIAKKPNRSTAETQAADPEPPKMIRFDRELLGRVDAAAKRRGISRSAWVQYTISRALDIGDG